MNAREKLIKARAGLVLGSPFFASIALHLKLVEDATCETAYTDSVVLGYSPSFIDELTLAETKALICHEVMHVAMLHAFRRKNRDHQMWNVACDYAINPVIDKTGMLLPDGALFHHQYDNMEAEAIYARLQQDKTRKRHQKPSFGEVRDYKPKPGDLPMPQQMQNTKIQVSQAMTTARMQGKLPQDMERTINEILQPQLPWKEILSRFITQNSRNDYRWKQPNGRYLHAGLYLPTLSAPSLGTIAVLIDTSGSVNQTELDLFASELKSILASYPDTTIHVAYVDSHVAHHHDLALHDFHLEAQGGGGTDYRPGFAHIEDNLINPSCILYFTDGYCDAFPDSCDTPTLWIVTERQRFSPPFGEVVYLKNDQR